MPNETVTNVLRPYFFHGRKTMSLTWWMRRSNTERLLLSLLVVAIFVLVVLVCVILHLTVLTKDDDDVIDSRYKYVVIREDDAMNRSYHNGIQLSQGDKVCITPACVKHAALLLDNMDLSAEPCDDFYTFSCGRFLTHNTIPDDRSTVSVTSKINDDVIIHMRTLLEQPIRDADTRPTRLAKTMFKSCMNTETIERRGLEPIKKTLDDVGGWPLLIGPSWDEDDFDWRNLTYMLRELGESFNLLLDITVDVDIKNNSIYAVYVDQPSLGLDTEYLVKGKENRIVQAYLKLQRDVAVVFGVDLKIASEETTTVLEFEMELAKILLRQEDRRDPNDLYHKMTIAEMKKEFPLVDWKDFLNNILKTEKKLEDNDSAILEVPKYLKDLENLLSKTDKRTLANFMFWSVVLDNVYVLPEAIRKVYFEFQKEYDGILVEQPTWRRCTKDVTAGNDFLIPAVGSLYIRELFDKDSKIEVNKIVLDIQKAFKEILKRVEWMDDETRKHGLEKVAAMKMIIGYPEELLNDTILEKRYENLELTEEDFLDNSNKLIKIQIDETYSKIWKKADKFRWVDFSETTEVNAAYHPEKNAIDISAGILQGLMFNGKVPKYLNYGAIGSVIGHEITHGFDDEGRQYDKNGELKDWWSENVAKTFVKKAECIVEQYGNYTDTLTGLSLNGINTQGENIADNGGVKEAYLAYVEWSGRQRESEPRLPGLETLSPKQMFWVSFAQSWCEKYRKEEQEVDILTDPHAPSRFRVLGSLSNREEFSSDFQCPLGTTMNPVRKCKVW